MKLEKTDYAVVLLNIRGVSRKQILYVYSVWSFDIRHESYSTYQLMLFQKIIQKMLCYTFVFSWCIATHITYWIHNVSLVSTSISIYCEHWYFAIPHYLKLLPYTFLAGKVVRQGNGTYTYLKMQSVNMQIIKHLLEIWPEFFPAKLFATTMISPFDNHVDQVLYHKSFI